MLIWCSCCCCCCCCVYKNTNVFLLFSIFIFIFIFLLHTLRRLRSIFRWFCLSPFFYILFSSFNNKQLLTQMINDEYLWDERVKQKKQRYKMEINQMKSTLHATHLCLTNTHTKLFLNVYLEWLQRYSRSS